MEQKVLRPMEEMWGRKYILHRHSEYARTDKFGGNPCTKVLKRGQYEGKSSQMKWKWVQKVDKMNEIVITCSDYLYFSKYQKAALN